MKKIMRIFLAATLLFLVAAISILGVYADEMALYGGNSGVATSSGTNGKISYGIDVIASENNIELAGIFGQPLSLSADKFACALNLSSISSIEITSIPDKSEGKLYLGSTEVKAGQSVSQGAISLLSFEYAGKRTDGVASKFNVRVNGGAYEMTCLVYMLDKVNASPTLSAIPTISLNIETYRDVAVGGVLYGYDIEGDELTCEFSSYPENGYITMVNKNSGEFLYTPFSGYSGKDEFTYVVKDKYGNYSECATVKINIATPYSSVVYSDLVGDGDYSYAINMTDKNVMNGEKVGDYYYFRPDAKVSRVDFVVSAMKMLGIENIPSVTSTAFVDDESIGDEVKGYISLAYSNKYISGIDDGGKLYFKPDESITLSEAAVIISNIIGYSEYKTTPTFANSDSIPAWSKDAVMSLRALGIIEAPIDSEFENKAVDRGCMAKLLSRAARALENV